MFYVVLDSKFCTNYNEIAKKKRPETDFPYAVMETRPFRGLLCFHFCTEPRDSASANTSRLLQGTPLFTVRFSFCECRTEVNAALKLVVAPPTPGQHHLEIKTSHVSIRSDSSIWRLCSSVLHFCDLKLNGISFGWILNPRLMACDVEETIHSQRPQVWRLYPVYITTKNTSFATSLTVRIAVTEPHPTCEGHHML